MHAFTVLADPARRCILDLIAGQAEAGQPLLTAGEIAATLREEMGLSQPAVSQHLKVLRDTGFAAVTIDGTRRRYAVQEDGFREVVHWLERYRPVWSQRLDALETELRRGPWPHHEEHAMKPIDFETVAGLTERGSETTDGGRYSVTLARDYAYPVADLWSAWTEPERLVRWLGVARGERVLGGLVRLVMSPPDGDVAELTVTACEPPTTLAVRWSGWDEPVSSVRLDLSALPDGSTRLRLSHTELDLATSAAGYGAGWEEFLTLCAVHLAGDGTRDRPGYDRSALETSLRPLWDELVGVPRTHATT